MLRIESTATVSFPIREGGNRTNTDAGLSAKSSRRGINFLTRLKSIPRLRYMRARPRGQGILRVTKEKAVSPGVGGCAKLKE